MLEFDDDVSNVEDFLAEFDNEPELTDKKWRFNARVHEVMKRHNLTRDDASGVIETVIRTKETDKRCKCGHVAYFVVRDSREILCSKCREEQIISIEDCL